MSIGETGSVAPGTGFRSKELLGDMVVASVFANSDFAHSGRPGFPSIMTGGGGLFCMRRLLYLQPTKSMKQMNKTAPPIALAIAATGTPLLVDPRGLPVRVVEKAPSPELVDVAPPFVYFPVDAALLPLPEPYAVVATAKISH